MHRAPLTRQRFKTPYLSGPQRDSPAAFPNLFPSSSPVISPFVPGGYGAAHTPWAPLSHAGINQFHVGQRTPFGPGRPAALQWSPSMESPAVGVGGPAAAQDPTAAMEDLRRKLAAGRAFEETPARFKLPSDADAAFPFEHSDQNGFGLGPAFDRSEADGQSYGDLAGLLPPPNPAIDAHDDASGDEQDALLGTPRTDRVRPSAPTANRTKPMDPVSSSHNGRRRKRRLLTRGNEPAAAELFRDAELFGLDLESGGDSPTRGSSGVRFAQDWAANGLETSPARLSQAFVTGTQQMVPDEVPQSQLGDELFGEHLLPESTPPAANRRRTWNGPGNTAPVAATKTPKMEIQADMDCDAGDVSPSIIFRRTRRRQPSSAPGGRKRRIVSPNATDRTAAPQASASRPPAAVVDVDALFPSPVAGTGKQESDLAAFSGHRATLVPVVPAARPLVVLSSSPPANDPKPAPKSRARRSLIRHPDPPEILQADSLSSDAAPARGSSDGQVLAAETPARRKLASIEVPDGPPSPAMVNATPTAGPAGFTVHPEEEEPAKEGRADIAADVEEDDDEGDASPSILTRARRRRPPLRIAKAFPERMADQARGTDFRGQPRIAMCMTGLTPAFLSGLSAAAAEIQPSSPAVRDSVAEREFSGWNFGEVPMPSSLKDCTPVRGRFFMENSGELSALFRSEGGHHSGSLDLGAPVAVQHASGAGSDRDGPSESASIDPGLVGEDPLHASLESYGNQSGEAEAVAADRDGSGDIEGLQSDSCRPFGIEDDILDGSQVEGLPVEGMRHARDDEELGLPGSLPSPRPGGHMSLQDEIDDCGSPQASKPPSPPDLAVEAQLRSRLLGPMDAVIVSTEPIRAPPVLRAEDLDNAVPNAIEERSGEDNAMVPKAGEVALTHDDLPTASALQAVALVPPAPAPRDGPCDPDFALVVEPAAEQQEGQPATAAGQVVDPDPPVMLDEPEHLTETKNPRAARAPFDVHLVDPDYKFDKFGPKNLKTLALDAAHRSRQRPARKSLESTDRGTFSRLSTEPEAGPPLEPNLFHSASGKQLLSPVRRTAAALASFDGHDQALEADGADKPPAACPLAATAVPAMAENDPAALNAVAVHAPQVGDAIACVVWKSVLPTVGQERGSAAEPSAADGRSRRSESPDRKASSSTTPRKYAGFSSAAGRNLPPMSETQLREAESRLAEPPGKQQGAPPLTTPTTGAASLVAAAFAPTSPKSVDLPTTPVRGGGFSTAGGGRLPLMSPAKLQVSQSLLASSAEVPRTAAKGSSFATAGGNKLPAVTAEMLQEAEDFFSKDTGKEHLPMRGGSGFATATGKRLRDVGPEQLAKANQLLTVEDVAPLSGNGTLRTPQVDRTAAEVPHAETTPLPLRSGHDVPHRGQGFAKATGKRLQAVSGDRLLKAQQLLEDQSPLAQRAPEQADLASTFLVPAKPARPTSFGTPDPLPLRKLAKGRFNTPFKAPSVIRPNAAGIVTPITTPLPAGPAGTQTGLRNDGEGHLTETSSKMQRKQLQPVFNLQRSGGHRMTLRELQLQHGKGIVEPLAPVLLAVSSATAGAHKFETPDEPWGVSEAFRDLVCAGANEHLISLAWVANHYRWIVWKLACTVRKFPNTISMWNAVNVLNQLRYRYEQEVNRGRRSAVKLILERDGNPGRSLVLCVSRVLCDQGSVTVELTDGWYCIGAQFDEPLKEAVRRGKIYVGLKLVTCGAQLTHGEACPPLEAPPSVKLILNANSTRRARWDARLGFHRLRALTVPLRTLEPDGGAVSEVDVIVMRRSEMRFMETLQDGTKIVRTEQEEERAKREHQEKMFAAQAAVRLRMEQNSVSSYEETPPFGSKSGAGTPLSEIEDGRELLFLMRKHRDPAAFREGLRPRQLTALNSAAEEARERKRREMWQEAEAEAETLMASERNVVPFFRIKIRDFPRDGVLAEGPDLELTFWRPGEESWVLLKEGSRFRISSLSASSKPLPRRFVGASALASRVRLSTQRMTRYQPVVVSSEELAAIGYSHRRFWTCTELFEVQEGSDVDCVGLLLALANVEEIGDDRRKFRNAVVSDESGSLVVIRAKEGFGGALIWGDFTGPAAAAFYDLQHRGVHNRLQVPWLAPTESAVVKTDDRKPDGKTRLESLHQLLRDPVAMQTLMRSADTLLASLRAGGRTLVDAPASSLHAYSCTERELQAMRELPLLHHPEPTRSAPTFARLRRLPRTLEGLGTIDFFDSVSHVTTGNGRTVVRFSERSAPQSAAYSDLMGSSPIAVQLSVSLLAHPFQALRVAIPWKVFVGSVESLLDAKGAFAMPAWEEAWRASSQARPDFGDPDLASFTVNTIAASAPTDAVSRELVIELASFLATAMWEIELLATPTLGNQALWIVRGLKPAANERRGVPATEKCGLLLDGGEGPVNMEDAV
ncbi:hypothetical protein DFJ74DRAFT_326084 [Hyaloraphidium curvatum]|nr:hypothetical protein DFJ74DRAFT_326084 [Hyaloraphidium curvatum]